VRRAAGALAAAALAVPATAGAHGAGSDLRFTSAGLRPELPGVALEVAPGGGRVTAVNRSGATVTVLDARERPLFRLRPGGPAERRTPAGWKRAAPGTSITWHDHRTTAPAGGRLPATARITVLAGARRAVLAGTVTRVAPSRPAPAWPLLVGVPLLGLAGLVLGRRRAT
jgi:hypothetical protein